MKGESNLEELGEGNGTPLQHSCLENPMDRGAWWDAVHGVAKSQTRLSDFTFPFHFHAMEKETATHSSVLAWRIPGMGSHRVGHDWSDLAAAAAAIEKQGQVEANPMPDGASPWVLEGGLRFGSEPWRAGSNYRAVSARLFPTRPWGLSASSSGFPAVPRPAPEDRLVSRCYTAVDKEGRRGRRRSSN